MIGRAGPRGAITQPLLLSEAEGMRRIVADIEIENCFEIRLDNISSSIFN